MYNLASTDSDRNSHEGNEIVTIQLYDTPTENPMRNAKLTPIGFDDEETRAMHVGEKRSLFNDYLCARTSLHMLYGFLAAFILESYSDLRDINLIF